MEGHSERLGADKLMGIDAVRGTAYRDILIGSGSDEDFAGAEGNDFIKGMLGADHMSGNSGDDEIRGDDGIVGNWEEVQMKGATMSERSIFDSDTMIVAALAKCGKVTLTADECRAAKKLSIPSKPRKMSLGETYPLTYLRANRFQVSCTVLAMISSEGPIVSTSTGELAFRLSPRGSR